MFPKVENKEPGMPRTISPLAQAVDRYDATLRALARWAPLPLRLIVGCGFWAHGLAKIAKGPDHFIAILQAVGVPFPALSGWAAILTELIGGPLILLGAFVPLVSLPMAVVLAVAALTVHWPYGFSSIKLMAYVDGRAQFGPPGYETDLLYLACLVALVMMGPGPYAADNALRRRFGRKP
jgi:putative oxidoreductase